MIYQYKVNANKHVGIRLDKYISLNLFHLSRSKIKFLINENIIHISTTSYIKPIRRMGIDAIVSKNISAVNDTVKFIQSDQQSIDISRFSIIIYLSLYP